MCVIKIHDTLKFCVLSCKLCEYCTVQWAQQAMKHTVALGAWGARRRPCGSVWSGCSPASCKILKANSIPNLLQSDFESRLAQCFVFVSTSIFIRISVLYCTVRVLIVPEYSTVVLIVRVHVETCDADEITARCTERERVLYVCVHEARVLRQLVARRHLLERRRPALAVDDAVDAARARGGAGSLARAHVRRRRRSCTRGQHSIGNWESSICTVDLTRTHAKLIQLGRDGFNEFGN